MTRATPNLLAPCALLALLAAPAFADDPPAGAAADSSAAPAAATPAAADADSLVLDAGLASLPAVAAPAPAAKQPKLIALRPEVADNPWRLDPGPRPYAHRISFSPAYGSFGSKTFFAARMTFNPEPWLGYEWSIGHNPGQATHAALHTLSALLRYPLPGRFQPYASAGYGMVMVFPGPSINASPVTKNALLVGGGLEFFIRGDLALRADFKYADVFGRQLNHNGVVTYSYGQQTIGLAFYRTLAQ
jgi:opacity protein-like surface antigen